MDMRKESVLLPTSCEQEIRDELPGSPWLKSNQDEMPTEREPSQKDEHS